MADESSKVVLTHSQVRQLVEFYEESAAGERVMLQAAPNLGDGYVEAIVLGSDGEPTSIKRVLFPT